MIIAHRGFSSLAPENTIAAFEAAIAAGAFGIEWDVQEAADGTPIVFHDHTLERTSDGVGRVRSQSLGDLQKLDAGRWFDEEFAGEKIPTLQEAVRAVAGRVGHVYCELKAGLSVDAVHRAIRVFEVEGTVEATTIFSFDWWLLRDVRAANVDLRIGFAVDTVGEFEGAVLRASEAGNAIVHANYRTILRHPDLLAFARTQAVDVVVYTVDEVDACRTLLDMGVAGITTNAVERMAGVAG